LIAAQSAEPIAAAFDHAEFFRRWFKRKNCSLREKEMLFPLRPHLTGH